jgi:hypothetical protein
LLEKEYIKLVKKHADTLANKKTFQDAIWFDTSWCVLQCLESYCYKAMSEYISSFKQEYTTEYVLSISLPSISITSLYFKNLAKIIGITQKFVLNLQKFKKMNQTDLLNKSLNDILSRTFLTGLTTMFAALALLIWGGDTLRSFAFTIFWGVIVGTYSSIYVSTAFLTPFDLRATQEAQNNVNPFGNVQ